MSAFASSNGTQNLAGGTSVDAKSMGTPPSAFVLRETVLEPPKAPRWRLRPLLLELTAICLIFLVGAVIVYAWNTGAYSSPSSLLYHLLCYLGAPPTPTVRTISTIAASLIVFSLLVPIIVIAYATARYDSDKKTPLTEVGWNTDLPVNGTAQSLGEYIQFYSRLLSQPSSLEITPPERKPGERIVKFAVRIAQVAAWSVFLVVCAAVAYLVAIAEPSLFSKFPIRRKMLHFIFLIFGGLVAGCAALFMRSKLKSAGHLIEYDKRAPILLFRSFADDRAVIDVMLQGDSEITPREYVNIRFEQGITDELFRLGPVVALGAKSELLPNSGAARAYVDDSVWREKVISWLQKTELVIVVVGKGEGLSWELDQLQERGALRKTVFVFPPRRSAMNDLWAKYQVLQFNARYSRGFQFGANRTTRLNEERREFLESFHSRELREALSSVSLHDALMLWIDDDGQIFLIKSTAPILQSYEMALAIAVRGIVAARGAPDSPGMPNSAEK